MREWNQDVKALPEALAKPYRQTIHAVCKPVEDHCHWDFGGASAGIFTAREAELSTIELHLDGAIADALNAIGDLEGMAGHLKLDP